MPVEMLETVPLDLITMDGLNDEAANLIHSVTRAMIEPGDKGAVTVKIELERSKAENSASYTVKYKVTPTYPARGRHIIAHADLTGNLKVHASPTQMNLIEKPSETAKEVA